MFSLETAGRSVDTSGREMGLRASCPCEAGRAPASEAPAKPPFADGLRAVPELSLRAESSVPAPLTASRDALSAEGAGGFVVVVVVNGFPLFSCFLF